VWKWMVWLGILTGMYYVVVVIGNVVAAVAPFILDRRHFTIDRHVPVDRASAAFFESLNPAHLRWMQLEGIAAIVLLYTAFMIAAAYLMVKFVRLGPSSLHTGRYHFEQGHAA